MVDVIDRFEKTRKRIDLEVDAKHATRRMAVGRNKRAAKGAD